MWLPDEIRKCVVFVCIEGKNGLPTPGATGFLVSIPSEKNPAIIHIYLVTARHVAIGIANKKFFVSLNDKNGEARFIPGNDKVKWFYHPNHENDPADLAVVPFAVHESHDLKILPISMFVNEELIKSGDIGIGNDVFITGLFRHFSGKQKNIPIVRVGNIAMVPDEKVPTRKFGDIDAYLIEARSIGGLSGSPVFFCKEQAIRGNVTMRGSTKFFLGGLIHGHWDIPQDMIDSIIPDEDAGGVKSSVNVGIAIVTPAHKILETLNCDELKQMRIENDKRIPEPDKTV